MPFAVTTPPREILLRWLLALGLFALLIFFFSPSWGAFRLAARVPEMQGMIETRRGVSVLAQIEHPGAPIADTLHGPIQWRLLFPLIGRGLHLSPPLFFALAPLGGVLLLGLIVTLLRQARASWAESAMIGAVLGATSWFFTSTGWLGYFDSWLALGLLLVAFAASRWTLWAACLWAPWIDERFVMALPLALLCRYLWRGRISPRSSRFDWRTEIGVPAALGAVFLAIRLGVLPNLSAARATLGGYLGNKTFLDAPFGRLLYGVWEGLRASWLFVAGAIWAIGHGWPRAEHDPARSVPATPAQKTPGAAKALTPLWALILGGATAAVAVAGLAIAQDFSRSMTMLLPVAMLGALILVESSFVGRMRVLLAAAAAALLLPAHHVMNDQVNPIFYLYHELAALDSPPPAAMPELYELRAIHEMERNEFAQADTDLALAMKLANNPASPAKQRGILAATQRRWADALRYFSILAEYDPQNPDAWFMCAQSHLALGDAPAAQTAFQHAVSIAPAEWTTRPDVARFMANLNKR